MVGYVYTVLIQLWIRSKTAANHPGTPTENPPLEGHLSEILLYLWDSFFDLRTGLHLEHFIGKIEHEFIDL